MIVVIGSVALAAAPSGVGRAAGMASAIAAASAAQGASVEILARVGDDGAGEEVLLALARAGVGHLAVLRDPARATALALDAAERPDDDAETITVLLADAEGADSRSQAGDATAPPAPALEAADLALGLRYLRDYRVVVAVEPIAEGGAAIIAEAASFAGAAVVVVAVAGAAIPAAYAATTLLEAPGDDREGAFAALVGRYAAALDRGVAPAEAFHEATTAGGWEAAGA